MTLVRNLLRKGALAQNNYVYAEWNTHPTFVCNTLAGLFSEMLILITIHSIRLISEKKRK